MRHSHKSAPEINAGSVADIAFVLLIFLLVPTSISAEKCFNRRIPPTWLPSIDCSVEINELTKLQKLLLIITEMVTVHTAVGNL